MTPDTGPGDEETARAGGTVIRADNYRARRRQYAVVSATTGILLLCLAWVYLDARERIVAVNGAWFSAFALAVVTCGVAAIAALRIRPHAYEPAAIEVGPFNIELRFRNGTGRQWTKSEGSRVRLKGQRFFPRLEIGDAHIGVGYWQLSMFPLAQLRAACVRHGWSWHENQAVLDAASTAAPDAAHANAGTDTVVLRSGKPQWRTPIVASASVAALLLMLALAVLARLSFEVPLPWIFAALTVLFIVGFMAYTAAYSRRIRTTCAVDSDRLLLSYGATASVIYREQVSEVVYRRGCLHLHHRHCGPVLEIRMRGKSDAVRNLLELHGWPVRMRGKGAIPESRSDNVKP